MSDKSVYKTVYVTVNLRNQWLREIPSNLREIPSNFA